VADAAAPLVHPNSTLASTLFAPMALQEIALAVWLIVTGFDATALGVPSTIGGDPPRLSPRRR